MAGYGDRVHGHGDGEDMWEGPDGPVHEISDMSRVEFIRERLNNPMSCWHPKAVEYGNELIGIIDRLAGEAERKDLALRNVRALAARMARRVTYASDDAAHLLRYCADGGVVARVLRKEEDSQ